MRAFLRQILRSPATTGKQKQTKPNFTITNQNHFHSTAIIPETQQPSKEKNNSRGGGKWVTLPPFAPTVNSVALGKRISGGNESVNVNVTAVKWVLKCCPDLPRSLVHKLFRLRQVRRECIEESSDDNSEAQNFRLKRVGAKDVLGKGDRICLPVSVDEAPVAVVKTNDSRYSEEERKFIRSLVLYKDSAIIAINKPAKLPVQGGPGIKKSLDELAAACLRYDFEDPPRLVHRLDRDSSGILVLGRTKTSTAVLHSIFRENTVGLSEDEIDVGKKTLQKRYLALVFGVPNQSKGLISAPLAKVVVDDGKTERVTVAHNTSTSQHAVTEYRVIETSPYGYTWLELCPLTGRKHQLRVHCAEVLQTPIVGDYKYGWQAHRQWEPLPCGGLILDEKPNGENWKQLGLDFDCGSIAEKSPHLHLHCKQLTLPNISLALDHASPSSEYDFSNLQNINLVAPLPLHMQNSWKLLSCLAKHGQCEYSS